MHLRYLDAATEWNLYNKIWQEEVKVRRSTRAAVDDECYGVKTNLKKKISGTLSQEPALPVPPHRLSGETPALPDLDNVGC